VTKVLGGGRALLARGDGGSWFVRLDPKLEEVARGLAAGSRVRIVGASPVGRACFDEGPSADVVVEVSNESMIVSRA
jgi:hypothetical protein